MVKRPLREGDTRTIAFIQYRQYNITFTEEYAIRYTSVEIYERPWLNWIEHRSTEPKVTGSNPVGRDDINNCNIRTSDSVHPVSVPVPESDSAKSPAKTLQKYPELAQIIEAWPELSEPVKAGIVAMVQAAVKK